MKQVEFKNTENTFLIRADEYRAVSHGVSKEETRYYLNGVYVEGTDQGVQLTATSGTILISSKGAESSTFNDCGEYFAKITKGENYKEGENQKGLIIKVDTAEKAFKAKPALPSDNIWMYFNIDEMTVQFLSIPDKAIDGHEYPRVGICEFSIIDGIFPDWRRVVPKDPSEYDEKDKSHISIGFNPDYVTTLAKAHKCVSNSKAMQFTCLDSGSPAKVRFSGAERLLAVIMPMRF